MKPESGRKRNRRLIDRLPDLPQHVWLLLALQFLMNLSTFTAMPLMAVHMADHLRLPAAIIGTVFTIHLALGRAFPVITGPLVDRFGFRNFIVAGLIGRGGGFLLFSAAADAPTVIGATILICLGTAAYESAVYGLFGRQPHHLVTRVFILNNFALNLGVVIGPALGSFLTLYDAMLPFRAAALFFLLLGIWSLRFGYLDKIYAGRSSIAGSWGGVLNDRRFLWFLATTLPWWFLFAQLFVAFPLYATQLAGNENAASAVFLANGIGGMVFVALSLIAFKWIRPRQMTALCYALLFATYCAVPAWHSLRWMLLMTFIYTIAESLILPAIETITSELAPHDKQATYFGALGLAWGLGAAMGSYAGSWMVLDVRAPYLIWGLYASIAALGFLLALAFRRAEPSFERAGQPVASAEQ